MKMSEKCRNNSDNPLTSRRIDGGKNDFYNQVEIAEIFQFTSKIICTKFAIF